MKEEFLRHFEYDFWANQRFTDFLNKNTLNNEKVYSILGHIMSAQVLWLKRIIKINLSDYPLWKVYSNQDLIKMNNESYQAWKEFISGCSDQKFAGVISYTNTKGVSYNTPLNEIVQHVLYHGAYHRGQLATLIRQSDMTPPYTDYIAFVRNE